MSTRGGRSRGRSGGGGASSGGRSTTIVHGADADDALQALFGQVPSETVLARVFAVEAGGTTQLRGYAADRTVTFRTTSAHSRANGYVGSAGQAQSQLVIWDMELAPSARGLGLGTRLVARQLKAAARLGVEYATLEAARNDARGLNGYEFWPRVGFYGQLSDLSAATRAVLPAGLAGAHTTLDLQRTAAGRAWWTTHGETVRMRFDLQPASSSSFQVLWRHVAHTGLRWRRL